MNEQPTLAFRLLIVAAVYFCTAWAGLQVASAVSASITTLWAPAGIAVTAVLIWGRWMLIAVYIGAFAVNATTGDASLPAAVMMAAGNTAEAFTVAFLLFLLGFNIQGNNPGGNIPRLLFAAAVGCLIAANVGTMALEVTGALDPASLGQAIRTWWFGDLLGIVVLTPALLFFLLPYEQHDRA